MINTCHQIKQFPNKAQRVFNELEDGITYEDVKSPILIAYELAARHIERTSGQKLNPTLKRILFMHKL